eukprot:scaffold35306_cov61-Phaeocystis_antarctica.AAC.3
MGKGAQGAGRTASTWPGCSSSGTTTVTVLPATHTRHAHHIKRWVPPPPLARNPVHATCTPHARGARAPNSMCTSKLSPGFLPSGTVTTSWVSFRRSALSPSGGRPCSLCAGEASGAWGWGALVPTRGGWAGVRRACASVHCARYSLTKGAAGSPTRKRIGHGTKGQLGLRSACRVRAEPLQPQPFPVQT